MRRVVITHLQLFDTRSPIVYLPYIYGTLRSYAEQSPEVRAAWEFVQPVWRVRGLEEMLEEVGEPDVLGCSVYVWNHLNSHRLARAVKERFPRCLVVFGGPHVPNAPSDYLDRHPWVDLLVHGEGEECFRGILQEALREVPDWERVPGLSYRRDGAQRFSAAAGRLKDLDFPGPYSTGLLEPFLADARRAFPDAIVAASLETNRGCPYSCAFCDWGMATMTKLRQFPEDRVRADLEWMARHEVSTVILNDANFGILPRDVGLAQAVVDLKQRHGYPRSFLPLGFAKNNKDRAFEITRMLRRHGMDAAGHNVNFSLQSMSQGALDAIQRQNIPLANYRELSERYAGEGYRLMPDLIFPLPGETLASFREGYAELASWGHVDRIMVYPCSILPNAPMSRPEYRERWGLVTKVTRLPSQVPMRLETPEAEWETVETVVSTSLISEKEAAEVRGFVALVDACEFAGLTRELRKACGRLAGLTPAAFYEAVLDWQLRHAGRLFTGVAQVYLHGLEHPEEPMWMAYATTLDGEEMSAPRALIADVLGSADRFAEEMRGALHEILGPGERTDDLLRYQADRWIRPDYDPEKPAVFEYRWDWPAFLEEPEAPLQERPVRVTYHAGPEWAASPFRGTYLAWQILALGQAGADPACVHADGEVERLLQVSDGRGARA